MNPTFETISAADLAQRLSSPMGLSAVRSEALAWCRADALVSGLAAALVELRDRGSLTLNLETICDHLRLGVGVHSVGKNPGYTDVSQVSREDWERTRAASGFTELYVRALNGEFSKDTKERIVGFMESLPCFSRTKALQGVEQDAKAKAQFSLATGMFVGSFFMDRHFQTISAEDLAQQISATMGRPTRGGDFARARIDSLILGLASALVELRDSGELTLNVQAIRDHLRLGVGVHSVGDNPRYSDVSQVSNEDWERTRKAAGLSELYVRALNGEFSKDTRERIVGFMDTLPEFSPARALQGVEQNAQTQEQFTLTASMWAFFSVAYYAVDGVDAAIARVRGLGMSSMAGAHA